MSRRVSHAHQEGFIFCENPTNAAQPQPQLRRRLSRQDDQRSIRSSHLVPTSQNMHQGTECHVGAESATATPMHHGCTVTTELMRAMKSLSISDIKNNRSEMDPNEINNEIPNYFESNPGGEVVRGVYTSCLSRDTRSQNNSNVRSVFECAPVTYIRGGAWLRTHRRSKVAYANLNSTEQKCGRKNSPSSTHCLADDERMKKQARKRVSFRKAPSIKWFKSEDRIELSTDVGKSQLFTVFKKLMSRKKPKREKKQNIISILKKTHDRL